MLRLTDKKKAAMTALLILMAVQLAVPLGLMAKWYDVLANGTEIKLQAMPIDPYDAFRGRYVTFTPALVLGDAVVDRSGQYGVVAIDPEGYGIITAITDEKPDGQLYITSGSKYVYRLPIDRYYMDERLAPEAERVVGQMDADAVYVTVRVKNGHAVVSGLFVDGVAIEDVVDGGDYD